jgi:hypothetical protein
MGKKPRSITKLQLDIGVIHNARRFPNSEEPTNQKPHLSPANLGLDSRLSYQLSDSRPPTVHHQIVSCHI